jgi:hypothetical protein
MKTINKLFFVLFLVYFSNLPARLGLVSATANEIMILLFSFSGLLAFSFYLPAKKYRVSKLDLFLLLFLIVYPLISSLTAYITQGQPFYMGILTFRSLFILFAYYVFLLGGPGQETVMRYSENTVLTIIAVAVILVTVFGYTDFNTPFVKGSLVIKYGHTTTKGLQFSGFSCLFFIPYIYGWVKYFEKEKPVYLVIPAVILIISVYIVKARNEILTLTVIPLFMYYLKYRLYDIRYLVISGLIVCVFFVVVLTDNVVSRSFGGLLHPGDLDYAHRTKDYSAYLRIEEIRSGWQWFLKYPVTGLGSLSYRFNHGYQGLISQYFFVSDIGLIGLLVKGGILLLTAYLYFYNMLFKMFRDEDIYSVTGRYLVLFLVIELLLGNDYLVNYTGGFVVLFLLLPVRSKLNKFVKAL